MTSTFASPGELEVWFLSTQKTTSLAYTIHSALWTEFQCQQMGEYCFDPQQGLYKKDDVQMERIETSKLHTESPSMEVPASVDRDLIKCDTSNVFDIYCGKKTQPVKSSTALEIWIDTSSSMREFDHSDKQGHCFRKSFIKDLDQGCGLGKKVSVMAFDTSIKEVGEMSTVCSNEGLNDMKRLMDWIERSQAKKLIIITDIYEYHREFADFVEKKKGKFRGEKTPLTAQKMAELAQSLIKDCH
jgi:hypothetical protein